MTFVLVSHSPFSDVLVVGSHHLARGLARAGNVTWHIGPPVTPAHLLLIHSPEYRDRILKAIRSPLKLQERLFSLEPFTLIPWQIARYFLTLGNPYISFSNLSFLAKSLEGNSVDVLIIDNPKMAGIEKILKPKALYYRPTDLYATWKKDRQIVEAERKILARCNGVIATSQPVLDHATTLVPGLPSLLLENGVDFEHFISPMDEPDELKSIPHPRAIYMGVLDDRFDVEGIHFMATSLPEIQFLVIGSGENLEKIRSLKKANLHVLGPKPYKMVPAYLQAADIGLLPLKNNLANSGRSPMKLYEYGAAGLPVVSSRTEELTRRNENFTFFYSSHEESLTAIRHALSMSLNRQKIAECCRSRSWPSKVLRLLNFIKKTSNLEPLRNEVSLQT